MSSQPDLKLVIHDRHGLPATDDERIEDYLDHLCAPLIGIVPYCERMAFRQEAHAHIDALIRDYLYAGKAPEEATESALREFGEPWKVGQSFLQEWSQGTPQMRPARLIRKATWTAFAWFGVASMLTLLLLEQVVLPPRQDALLPGVLLLAFLAPFVVGSVVGRTLPAQTGRGVRNALLILVLHSFVTGLLLLPRQEGLLFALWQLLFWLPVGHGTASVTALWVRHVRRQRFWQAAR